MAESNKVHGFVRGTAIKDGLGLRYQHVPHAEADDSDVDGFGGSFERPKPSPVSPLSSPYGTYSPSSTQLNTPGFSAGFPSPAFVTHSSFQSSDTELPKSGQRHVDCPTNGDILVRPWSWITIFMCFLALYSFCFSGVFLGIALAKPRWGRSIGSGGKLSYSTATLLSALFSKTVELSFVAVLVATIGQILSRRAIARKTGNRGITIAEMTMRSWILQPGLVFTHSDAVRYAGPTVLGVLVLVATIAATFYTTAAEALASPKLKFGGWEDRWLVGRVDTAFANVTYLTQSCDTPIAGDPEAGSSCTQIEYAGQSYHNFQSFLANWTSALEAGPGNSSLSWRPRPVAMLYDNTTVVGQWIAPSGENITRDSTDRLIHNITMAMPHANLFNAARNPANGVAQPAELGGLGEYFIVGALPAPTLNVLCAGLSSEEVVPFIYDDEPPHSTGPTALDDVFNFGDFYQDGKQPAPLFQHLPIVYNTVNNNSLAWGPHAVYLLATPPDDTNIDHVLCSIKITQYPSCTTKYHAAESGGQLSIHCDDDPGNTMPYSDSVEGAPVGIYESNWKDIGSEWLRANALSHGVTDGNASIARIVTQMTPRFEPGKTLLNPQMPSIGEALAVLAGSTTVMSSLHAPFNHTERSAGPSTEERFMASAKFKDYSSGGSQNWQGVFYITLSVVFLINLFSLVYLVKNLLTDGQVTDFCEPQNLFALAFMSPPSQSLSGSCGSGPSGAAFGKRFKVDMEKSETQSHAHPHFYVRCTDDVGSYDSLRGEELVPNTVNRRGRVRSMQNFHSLGESPAIEQYRRLAG